MRSEPTTLRTSPRGLSFPETPPRALCVRFLLEGDTIEAAACRVAARRVIRFDDLPDPVPPAPFVLRVSVS